VGLRDEIRRRQGQEAQHLHHQRRDEIVKEILAPFVAEHDLFLVLGEQPLDRDKQRAGEQHIENEEIEAEEDAAELIVPIRRQAADHGGEQRHHHGGRAERLLAAQRQAEGGEQEAPDQREIEKRPIERAAVDGGQFRHPRDRRIAQHDHHAETGEAREQAERAGEPARAERAPVARGFEFRRDIFQEGFGDHGPVQSSGCRANAPALMLVAAAGKRVHAPQSRALNILGLLPSAEGLTRH
jgi:hypothetical protein